MLDAFLRNPTKTLAAELDTDALLRAFSVAIIRLYDSHGADKSGTALRRLIVRELKERTGE